MLPALIETDPVLEQIQNRQNIMAFIDEYFIFINGIIYQTYLIDRLSILLDYIKEHEHDQPNDILKSNDYRLLCDWL